MYDVEVFSERVITVDLAHDVLIPIDGFRTSHFILDEKFNIRVIGIKQMTKQILKYLELEEQQLSDESFYAIENKILEFNPLSNKEPWRRKFIDKLAHMVSVGADEFLGMTWLEARYEHVLNLMLTNVFMVKLASLVYDAVGKEWDFKILAKTVSEMVSQDDQGMIVFDFSTSKCGVGDPVFFSVDNFAEAKFACVDSNPEHARLNDMILLRKLINSYLLCDLESEQFRDAFPFNVVDEEEDFENLVNFLFPIAMKQRCYQLICDFVQEKTRAFMEGDEAQEIVRKALSGEEPLQ